MQRAAIPGLISLAWLVMMYGLVRDDVLPTLRRGREITHSASYERLEESVTESRVTQMGIYFGEHRLGQSVSLVKRRGREMTLESETEINLKNAPALQPLTHLLGGGVHGKIRFRAFILDGRLLNFRSQVSCPPGTAPAVVIEGIPLGDRLRLEIRQFGQRRIETVPFDQRQFIHSVMTPTLAVGELAVGKKWLVKELDQMTGSVTGVWAEVLRKETLTLDGMTHEAFVVQLSRGLLTVQVWVNAEGEVLKQQLMGFTFVREEPSAEFLAEASR